MSNSIILHPENDDLPESWSEIVDKIIAETHLTDIAPERVIKAVEMLIAGYDKNTTAKELGVKPSIIDGWMEKYPTMRAVIQQGRKALSKWRLAKLEQQFVTALQKSEEIINLDLYDREVNPKILAVVAQQARFIIGLVGQVVLSAQNQQMEQEQQLLKAKQDALAYIASELIRKSSEPSREKEDSDVIEGTFREEEQPILDENGQPFYGEFGVLDKNTYGIQCHICGERFRNFASHIRGKHRLSPKEYEATFLLGDGEISACQKRA